MNHRELSIAFLSTSGVIPVRVRPGQKDPYPDWDPRRAALEDHKATLQLLRVKDPPDNIGGLFCGKWVDADIDTDGDNPTLRAALSLFLPPSRHMWGRASKPESHRLYCLPEDFDRAMYSSALRTIKKAALGEESFSIEIRGGKAENGLFTVMPGSQHPSGEWVEWSNEVDTTVSSPTLPIWRLIKGIRLAQAAAMITPYWTEGMRNDLSLALSGLMWRIRAATMAIMGIDDEDEADEAEGGFILRQKDAENLLKAVMRLAGDDEADQKSRMINMVNSWRKLDDDPSSRVSGGKVLMDLIGDGGEPLVKALYRLLSDNDGAEQLEALCDKFCMWYGQGVLIDKNMVEIGADNPYMSKEQATNSLAGQKVRMGDKKVPIIAILFGTSILQRVYGLTFDPSTVSRVVETKQGIKINQWRGFEIEASPQTVMDYEVEKFTNYIKNIVADGNEQLGEWVLDWCADIFQDPANKPGTALVLVGVHGAGKTFLGEKILGPIIGESHYVQFNSIENLTSKHNSIAQNKVFIQCDEAMHSHQKEVASKLKSLVTDATMTIEPKNINSYKAPSHARFLFTSNDEQAAVFIDPSPTERRYTVSRVSDRYAKDLEYWEDMYAWLPMALPKILRWLLDRKYDKKAVRRPIETEAKRELQRVGVDPEVSWLITRVMAGFPLEEASHEHWWQAFHTGELDERAVKRDSLLRDTWPNTIHIPTLQNDLRAHIRKNGRPVYTGSLATALRRIFPPGSLEVVGFKTVEYNEPRHGQPIKDRVRLYHFPTKDQILEHLKNKFGAMIDILIEAESKEYANLDHLGSSSSKEQF